MQKLRAVSGITILSLSALLASQCKQAAAQDPGSTGASIMTWQQDIGVGDVCTGCSYRTGENLKEATITYSSIKTDNFGQLCNHALDGQVYAQPLVVTSVPWNGGARKTVVYVVTQNDTIYAFDGAPPVSGGCTPLGSLQFFTTPTMSGQTAVNCTLVGGPNCTAIKPYIGILGTPVIHIDTTTHKGTIYLVTESQSGNSQSGYTFYHYLHALDISNLSEVATPVRLSDSTGASAFSKLHIQRPGLAYGNGYVYVAFSMMDGNSNPYPNGAIFSFSASTLASAGYFATSAGTISHDGGGIWQDGAGLAYGWDNNHSTYYVYLNTGNGAYTADSSGADYGDSFLKLYQVNSTTIGLASTQLSTNSFTPADAWYREACGSGSNAGDWDYGSGGVMLIPEHELYSPSLAVSADKEGGLYFVNRTTPGGHHVDTGCDTTCTCTYDDNGIIVQNFWLGTPHTGPVVHSTPVFWETGPTSPTAYLYIATTTSSAGSGELMRYTLCPTASQPPISSVSPCTSTSVVAKDANSNPVIFGNGVTPAISAASTGETSAILWAIRNDGLSYGSTNPGVLYAFDAVQMTQLYASSTCQSGRDSIAPATKFSVPSVADGFVYVGTQGPIGNTGTGMFYIFGPGATGTC